MENQVLSQALQLGRAEYQKLFLIILTDWMFKHSFGWKSLISCAVPSSSGVRVECGCHILLMGKTTNVPGQAGAPGSGWRLLARSGPALLSQSPS